MALLASVYPFHLSLYDVLAADVNYVDFYLVSYWTSGSNS